MALVLSCVGQEKRPKDQHGGRIDLTYRRSPIRTDRLCRGLRNSAGYQIRADLRQLHDNHSDDT